MAQVTLNRLDNKFHFLAKNSTGNSLHLDVGPEEGGSGQGVGPMQAVAMALGGCSGIDIVLVLTKQRQNLQKFDTIITYDRAEDESPSLFTKLHVHFEFEGQLAPDKVRHAVDLSINKYCSVAKIIEKTAPITVSWTINGDHYSLDSSN